MADKAITDRQEHHEAKSTQLIPARESRKTTPIWWPVLMFALSLVYLIPEAIFNAKLVSVAGAQSIDQHQLELVELFGRTISGIGASLLIADLLIRGWFLKTIPRALIGLAIVFLVAWPIVFAGQKWAIETFLIESSSAKQRQDAVFSQQLRNALSNNTVRIAEIPFTPEQHLGPSDFTFLALFGGLVYADDTFIKHLDDQRESIVRAYIENTAYQNFKNFYARYNELISEFGIVHDEYLDKSSSYDQAMGQTPHKADEQWVRLQQSLQSNWLKYEDATRSFDAKTQGKAQKITPDIIEYFEDFSRCHERYERDSERIERCTNSLGKGYERLLDKNGISYIAPGYWLIIEDVSTTDNFFTTALTAAVTGGVSLLGQGADILLGGDGGWEDKRYAVSEDVSHYYSRLHKHSLPEFKSLTSGLSYGLDRRAFMSSEEVGDQVRSKLLREHNLELAPGWTPKDKPAFQSAAIIAAREQIDNTWYSEAKSRGYSIPPGLPWEKFQLHPEIQSQVKRHIGERNYIKPMRLDWNNQSFLKYVVEPNIERNTKIYLNHISALQVEFDDGGIYEKSGKDALRATIIPPISMTLSLFLVLATTLKLPFKAKEIYNITISSSRSTQPVQRLGGLIKPITLGVLILLLLTIPIFLMEDDNYGEESAVQYFLDQINEKQSPVYAYSLRWTLNTQPIVMPLGELLDESTGVIESFESTMEPLKLLDQFLFSEVIDSLPAATKDSPRLYPLVVTTAPENARIRIMNIRPRYLPGILLKGGDYDIEVSSAGYISERRMVKLDSKTDDQYFKLEAM